MGYQWRRVTTDQVLSKVACNIGQIIVSPDSDDDRADVTFHDGESANDPTMLTIRTGAGITKSIVMSPPLLSQRGLYVSLGRYVGDCVIQFETHKA